MSFKTSLILFCAFIVSGTGIYILAHNGLYPIAVVNMDVITAKKANEDFAVAYNFFKNTLTASGSDLQTLNNPQSLMEIKRAMLDKLITDALIMRELRKRVDEKEFNGIAEKNILKITENNANIKEAAKKIYGLEFEDFKKIVLMPEAYREILAGRMFLNQEDFSKWLGEARAGANVLIFSSQLQWKENSVKF